MSEYITDITIEDLGITWDEGDDSERTVIVRGYIPSMARSFAGAVLVVNGKVADSVEAFTTSCGVDNYEMSAHIAAQGHDSESLQGLIELGVVEAVNRFLAAE